MTKSNGAIKKAISREIIKRFNIKQRGKIKIEKASKHNKYKIKLVNKNYFIYLHENESSQNCEKIILKKIEKAKVIAPRIICTGSIFNGEYYYNIVSEVKIKPIAYQKIDGYDKIAVKIFEELKKIHSIKEGSKCLIHGDLNVKNICCNKKDIAFLPVLPYAN